MLSALLSWRCFAQNKCVCFVFFILGGTLLEYLQSRNENLLEEEVGLFCGLNIIYNLFHSFSILFLNLSALIMALI